MRHALGRATPTPGRARFGWAVLAAILLAGPFVSHLHKSHDPVRPHGDWYSIYSIGRHSLETGTLEADEDTAVVRTQRYPPIARPLLMLMALPPKTVSAVLSFIVFAGLYGWCAWHVGRVFLRPSRHGRWVAAGLVLAPALPFIWADLTAGNLTSVLLASVTGAYVLAERGRLFRAGLVLSIGIMLKIIPVLCLLYFVTRRKWRVAWGVAAGLVFIGLVPSLAIFGSRKLWDYHAWWYRTQFSMYTPMSVIDHPIECTYQNQAVVRTMVRLFTPINAGSSKRPFSITVAEPPRIILKIGYFVVMGVSGLVLLGWLWRTRDGPSTNTAAAGYAVCVGSMLWFSPWIGSYYYSLAMWPAAGLLGYDLFRDDEAAGARWARRALLLWFVVMPALGSYWLRACGIHTLAAGVLLITLAWAARGAARESGVSGLAD